MKMWHLPPLLRGWGMVASVDMATKGIGFLLMPVYARYMLPDEFGIFSYVGMIGGVASGIFGFGQYAIFTRSELESDDQREMLIRGVLANIALGTVLWWAALCIIGSFFKAVLFSGPTTFVVWGVLAFQPVISLLSQLLSIDMFLSHRYLMGSMRALTECVLSHGFGLASVAYLSSRSSDCRLLSCAISGMVVLVLFLPFTRFWNSIKAMMRQPLSISIDWVGLREGVPLSLNSLIGLASNNGDRYLLEKIASKQQLGYFSFAGNLSNIVIVGFSSFNNIWLGVFYQRGKSNSWRVKKTMLVGLGWVVITVLSVLFFDVTFLVMKTWLGKYQQAKALIPLLGIAACFQVLTHLVVNFFNLWRKNKYTTPINFLVGVFSIIIGWLLIPKMGAMGAALQAASTAVLGFLMTLIASIWVGTKANGGFENV